MLYTRVAHSPVDASQQLGHRAGPRDNTRSFFPQLATEIKRYYFFRYVTMILSANRANTKNKSPMYSRLPSPHQFNAITKIRICNKPFLSQMQEGNQEGNVSSSRPSCPPCDGLPGISGNEHEAPCSQSQDCKLTWVSVVPEPLHVQGESRSLGRYVFMLRTASSIDAMRR